MDRHSFIELVTSTLGETILRLPGRVLYGPLTTLSKGNLYVVGNNPGGCEKDTIKSNIQKDHGEKWGRNRGDVSNPHDESDYQKRTRKILRALGTDDERVFITNSIFVRSHDTKEMRQRDFFSVPLEVIKDRSFALHKEFIRIVEPSVLLCLGNQKKDSPFSFFYSRAGKKSEVKTIEINERRKNLKTATVSFDPTLEPSILLLGIPHPSRPYSSGSTLLENMKNEIEKFMD